MNNNKTLLVLFLGVIVGCVANEAVRAGAVTAQATPSTPGQFRECVSYLLNYDGDAQDLAGEAKPIPAGWTPVGGAAGGQFGVILCR